MPSFNVQNAKSLEITEGDVATIHDADGRQLWGKLNYTTKYEGDTEQTTYSGKNLFYIDYGVNTQQYPSASSGNVDITTELNSLTIEATGTTGSQYLQINMSSLDNTKTYTLSAIGKKLAVGDSSIYARWRGSNDGTTWSSYTPMINQINPTVGEEYSFSNALSGYNRYQILFYNSSKSTVEIGEKTTYYNIQLEEGVEATAYEPYVGGVPSPNPSYPQPISVVTGTQTVTLTGGTVSEDYTIHLGTLELAKIGTYQDYIYKSNGNWYKHGAIGKIIYTGAQDESWNYTSGAHARFSIGISNIMMTESTSDVGAVLSNNFVADSIANIYNGTDYRIGIHNTNAQIWISYLSITSSADFKTWLSTHNTTVYYAIDTEAITDTQITDTDLIAELDAIEEWMTRCGYTASISGNLPIVINQTEIV